MLHSPRLFIKDLSVAVSYSKMMAGGIATALALSMAFGSAGHRAPAKSSAVSMPEIKYLIGRSALKQKFSDPADAIYARVQRSYAPASAVPAANGHSLRLVGWQI